jgi:hypothetical protein
MPWRGRQTWGFLEPPDLGAKPPHFTLRSPYFPHIFPWSFLVSLRPKPAYNHSMKDIHAPGTYGYDLPATYRIRVRGKIKASWSDRVEGMTITLEVQPDGATETTLVGKLRNQAAVMGVISTLYELHLELLSVSRLTGN